MDWSVFKNAGNSLNDYATAVTDFINKCVEDCVRKKQICVLPNRKPWMNRDFHCLMKSRPETFTPGDPDLCKKARYDRRRSIKDAKDSTGPSYCPRLATQTPADYGTVCKT